jgi:hypothetical protein
MPPTAARRESMARQKKTLETKLRDLESELYLVRRDLEGLPKDGAHLKSLSTQLRALLCFSSGTEGLLWRLADELKVADHVVLHLPGRVDLDHPLIKGKGLIICVAPNQRPGPHVDPRLPPAATYSFRQVIKTDESIWASGKSYTHETLIKVIAQQIGTAHESDDIEIGLATMEGILIQGLQPYVKILILDAELTLEVGERVLAAAEARGLFRRKRPPGN